jgi:hypothetical protein
MPTHETSLSKFHRIEFAMDLEIRNRKKFGKT